MMILRYSAVIKGNYIYVCIIRHMNNRPADQVYHILNDHLYKESLQKKSAVYLESYLRNSRFSYSVSHNSSTTKNCNFSLLGHYCSKSPHIHRKKPKQENMHIRLCNLFLHILEVFCS